MTPIFLRTSAFFIVVIVLVHYPLLLLVRRVRFIRGTWILFPDGFSSRVFATHDFMIVKHLFRIFLFTILTRFFKAAYTLMLPNILLHQKLSTVLAHLFIFIPRMISPTFVFKMIALHQVHTKFLNREALRALSTFFCF